MLHLLRAFEAEGYKIEKNRSGCILFQDNIQMNTVTAYVLILEKNISCIYEIWIYDLLGQPPR
jgi:hypothetical protein